MTDQAPLYYRPTAAAKALGVSRATLYRWANKGKIGIFKRGSVTLFRTSDVVALIEGRQSEPVPVPDFKTKGRIKQGQSPSAEASHA